MFAYFEDMSAIMFEYLFEMTYSIKSECIGCVGLNKFDSFFKDGYFM